PANARFVRATPRPTSRAPELLWDLGTMQPGDCRTIVLVLKPMARGEIKNCARVQFEHGQCVATRIIRPGITLRKRGPAQAVLNDTLTYQLLITNTGATDVGVVKVTDLLPDGLEHADGKKLLTWRLGTIPGGQSRTVEYQAVARKTGKLC